MAENTKQLRSFATKLQTDPKGRKITATISTAIADHDGEVLLPSGMDKTVFNANPLFLLYHKKDEFPLGDWDASSIVQRSHGITGDAEFIERPPKHPDQAEWLPDTALWYVQQGIVKALSVGFIPTNQRHATTKDLGRFGSNCKYVTTNWQLLEISLCNIPTNRDSLIAAVGKGIVGKSLLTELWEVPTRGKKSQIVVPRLRPPLRIKRPTLRITKAEAV